MTLFNTSFQNPRWWFVRHAPTVGIDGRIYGSLDVDCDTSSADQFQRLAALIPSPDYACISTLSRTKKTADALQKAGLAMPQYEEFSWLQEQGFGEWEGRRFDELNDISPSGESIIGFHSFYPSYAAPNGESFLDVVGRFTDSFMELNQRIKSTTNRLAVVHAGTIRAALVACLKMDPEASQKIVFSNLGLTVLEYVDSTWRCQCINHTV